jgi:hypothetical protein
MNEGLAPRSYGAGSNPVDITPGQVFHLWVMHFGVIDMEDGVILGLEAGIGCRRVKQTHDPIVLVVNELCSPEGADVDLPTVGELDAVLR